MGMNRMAQPVIRLAPQRNIRPVYISNTPEVTHGYVQAALDAVHRIAEIAGVELPVKYFGAFSTSSPDSLSRKPKQSIAINRYIYILYDTIMLHMIQNYSRWLVLRQFFDDPLSGFTMRALSKKIGLAATSVKLHIDGLSSEDKEGYPLVIKSKGVSYPVYKANLDSDLFRFYKKMDILFRLDECGLVNTLREKVSPQAIILFGSASRGEDTQSSDVDLFLLCKEKEMNLEEFEKNLNRRISLHFSDNFSKLPKELKNNIINGIRLAGYLEAF